MITVILNIYRRPEVLQKQIKSVKRQTIKLSQIWAWQNASIENRRFHPPQNIMVVKSDQNFFYHSRFALALLAQTEYVALFDDDVIPGERWLENCLHSFWEKPGLYVGSGDTLEKDMNTKRTWTGWRNPNPEITEVDYGGHAWFLKTDWLRYFWQEKQFSLFNGEDIQLSYALQKNAGIPTYVPPHPEKDISFWSNTVGWKYARSAVASYKNPPRGQTVKQWRGDRREIELACIENGWKPLYTRRGERGGES